MAPFKSFAFIAWIAVIAFGLFSFMPKKPIETAPNKGFAVVELFTSEGCSSCPPADELVAKIQKENADGPVYILAYHVDYWDRLGWKDPFSAHAYSERQYQYSNWLHLNGVYTPQAVVNGRTQFIGSEAGNMRNAIKNGLQNAASGTLQLTNVKVKDNKIELQYQTDEPTNSSNLVLAIVQKSATTQVKSGENVGRTLSHVQIVRSFQTSNLDGKKSGNTTIVLPNGLRPQDLELIAFLQNNKTGAITAAAKSSLSSVNASAQASVSSR